MDYLLPHDSLAGAALEKRLSVKAAAEAFGYNEQYLRRLLRAGRLEGTRIGQVWLIRLASLQAHLRRGLTAQDRRFGPQGIAAQIERGVTA